MKRNLAKGSWLRTVWRGALLSVFGISMVMLAGLTGRSSEDAGRQSADGWGGEAVTVLSEGATRLLPISLANACGLGASSCFKCHNGTRASAPSMDPKKSPWHTQHSKVNNSCTGCHKGNARIMKEDMAHAKLIAKPRNNSTDSCASCHTGDLAKVQAAYPATSGAK